MVRILQGIALILFGILLLMVGVVSPKFPVIGLTGRNLHYFLPLALGIAGLVMVFRDKK